MIIKIKKRSLILLLIAVLVSVPLIYAAASVRSAIFKVELAISNANPTIVINNITASFGSSQFSVDPTAAGTTYVIISFNASDPNGVATINASTAVVNLTLGNQLEWYSNVSANTTSEFGTCYNVTATSTVMVINCTVALPYFTNASGNWKINISIKDKLGGVGRNDSVFFTVNVVSGLALPYTNVNFSNVNLGSSNNRAYPHLLINNTGNDDFTLVNMSASALTGTTTSSETIGVGQFGVNLSNSSSNLYLTFPANGIVNLKDPTTGGNVSFLHGHTSDRVNTDKGNISAFIWVNVPSNGLSAQLYNGTWNVTATSFP